MAITGLPRTLPECSGCKDPVRRPTWSENDGKCNKCATPADRMRAAHKRAAKARLAQGSTSRGMKATDDRIASLAAKRADRAARQAMEGSGRA